jgi:hypothetical protein
MQSEIGRSLARTLYNKLRSKLAGLCACAGLSQLKVIGDGPVLLFKSKSWALLALLNT